MERHRVLLSLLVAESESRAHSSSAYYAQDRHLLSMMTLTWSAHCLVFPAQSSPAL